MRALPSSSSRAGSKFSKACVGSSYMKPRLGSLWPILLLPKDSRRCPARVTVSITVTAVHECSHKRRIFGYAQSMSCPIPDLGHRMFRNWRKRSFDTDLERLKRMSWGRRWIAHKASHDSLVICIRQIRFDGEGRKRRAFPRPRAHGRGCFSNGSANES